MIFEYFVFRTDKIPIFNDGREITECLNEFGRDGWELVNVEWTSPWTINLLMFSFTWVQKKHIFYFKRVRELK